MAEDRPTHGMATGAPTQGLSRRRLLGAAGAAMAAGLAGCSSVTSQEFAASPVRLPDAVREELGFDELFAESDTRTEERTVGGEDVEVTITNQFAGYARSRTYPTAWSASRPTLVERFAGVRPEATPGSGSAINVVASELELGQSNPSYVEGDTPVPADRITLVVPERARHDGELHHGKLMALHHAEALGIDELTVRGENNYLVEATRVLPHRGMAPSDKPDWQPDERWVAGHEGHWLPDDPSELRCLVAIDEQSDGSVFVDATCPECRLEDGESVSTERTLVASFGSALYPPETSPELVPEAVFDAGYPTPMGGPTYSLGVIATPDAEVAGQSVNPLARMDTGELLASEQATSMLANAGLTDADAVEWLREPEAVGHEWIPVRTATVLEEEVGVESYAGVVSGANGPWAVAIHLATATPDDAVITAATHRRPVGTPDGRELIGDGSGFVDRRWTTRALELTGDVFPSLVQDG